MNQKERLKHGLSYVYHIQDAIRRLIALVEDDVEGDNINECLKQNYPFQFSLDELRLEEWLEGYKKRMREILGEEEKITLTYETIKQTVGWERFADVTNRNVYEINEFGEPDDNERYQVTREQAKQLGFPVA